MTIARACLCAAIIICGLASRAVGLRLGLPAFIVKYGGSVLWGGDGVLSGGNRHPSAVAT